jgi:hypothetical protein
MTRKVRLLSDKKENLFSLNNWTRLSKQENFLPRNLIELLDNLKVKAEEKKDYQQSRLMD